MAVIPVPIFTVTLENGSFTFVCPLCSRRHFHGPVEGHRVSHCKCWAPQGYEIRLADAAPIEGGRA